MTIEKMRQLKALLLQHCFDYVEDLLDRAEKGIVEARTDAQQEQKSSAGDKFETHRAMMHLQMETFIKRKEVAEDLYSTLQRIALEKVIDQQIGLGSLIELERGWYYISISAPKFIHHNLQYTIISQEAPFYKQLQGKEVGDFIEWHNVNGEEDWIEILSVY